MKRTRLFSSLSDHRLLFPFAKEELGQQPDLTNQVLEVAIDESGEG